MLVGEENSIFGVTTTTFNDKVDVLYDTGDDYYGFDMESFMLYFESLEYEERVKVYINMVMYMDENMSSP